MNSETVEKTKQDKRELEGVVVSDRMDKTVVVQVSRLVRHSRYKKYISPHKRFKAHDERNECQIGDTVVVRESRPIGKDKHFTVITRNGSPLGDQPDTNS